jgi:hypothetical protein
MLGSTIGLAASFPEPYVKSGQADVAIVYGASAASSDLTAATSIQTSLSNTLASQMTATTVSVGGEGDKWKVEKSNDKFDLGDDVTDLKVSIDEDELPTLLAEGTYKSDDNEEYDYTQKITFANTLELKHFQDDDYADEPAVGMKIESSAAVLNYTLDFTDSIDSEVGTASTCGLNDLCALETTTLPLMGKSYYVLNADNETKTKLTLLDSANEAIVSEGTPATIAVGSKSYAVSILNINTDEVKLKINDETTNSLEETETYKLADGTYVGIKDISYNEKESGISSVEISLGSGKLVLENTEEVELNGESVDGVYAYISRSAGTGGKMKIEEITLEWKTDDEAFITPKQSVLMPGFEAIKLIMAGMNFPKEETTEVQNNGGDTVELSVPIVEGKATIPILYGNGSASGKFSGIGKDGENKLKTSGVTNIKINTTNNEKYFVASCASTTEGETYYLEVTKVDNNDGINETTIKNKLTGSSYTTKETDSLDKFGDISLLVNDVTEYGSTNKGEVNLTISGCRSVNSFNRVYSEEGLTIYLPVDSSAVAVTTGGINFTTDPTTYTLYMVEEDKEDTLEGGTGAKYFINSTLKLNGDGDVTVDSVTSVWSSGSSMLETGDGTDIYEGYVKSDLATQVLHDQGPDQRTLKVMYHGEESYADFFVASSKVSTGAAGALSGIVVKDSEASSMSGKNLVVVGGSCVNTVAAQVLGVASGTCGSAFTAATGVGANQALIKVVTSPLSASKIAMLVAGYEAEDTVKAATYVTSEKPSTAVGTTLKFDSATTTATAA